MRQLTNEDLKNSTSQDGNPNLVAVNGKVYDISTSQLWKNGHHMNRHVAGMDLSEAIRQAPHGLDRLDRVTLLGELKSSPAINAASAEAFEESEPVESPLPLIAALLKLHPHPISVHFPIALFIIAAAFQAIGLIANHPAFIQVAFYNLVAASLITPVSIVLGFISHRYNYGNVWSPIFLTKLFLSIVLLILSDAAVGLGIFMMNGSPSVMVEWSYRLVVFLLAPTVMALGYFGGLITFPR